MQIGGIECYRFGFPFGDFHRRRAQHRAQFAFEVAYSGLARVVADDGADSRIRDRDLFRFQSVGLHLALHEVAPGDFQFFFLGVTRKLDDLHAIAQRPRDGIELVGRGNEHDFRQIEIHGEVVVAELRVLLRIEHFEQRARRIAVETSGAEFVDLVEHEHAITRFGTANRLNDVAGQGANIGAPVAADFRLIVRAAQGDALELSPGGTRD